MSAGWSLNRDPVNFDIFQRKVQAVDESRCPGCGAALEPTFAAADLLFWACPDGHGSWRTNGGFLLSLPPLRPVPDPEEGQ